jgi:hypothetical protein
MAHLSELSEVAATRCPAAPEGAVTAHCRSCGAEIIWTTNVVTGKRMPVDPAPVPGANVVLTAGNDGPRARVLSPAEVGRRTPILGWTAGLHLSHFATCADTASWRKR